MAAEVAQRLVKPGNENVTVTENIQKVGDSFKCKPVEGKIDIDCLNSLMIELI